MARKSKPRYRELKGRLNLFAFRIRHRHSNLNANCQYKWRNAAGYREFYYEDDMYDWEFYKGICDKKVLGYWMEDGSIVQVTLEDDAA